MIVLRPGSRVPADGRLLEAHDLSVDESALTGESMPVQKQVSVIADPAVPLADRHNMVYRGTLVTGGSGRAIVVATGRHTQVGQLSAMIGEVGQPETIMFQPLHDIIAYAGNVRKCLIRLAALFQKFAECPVEFPDTAGSLGEPPCGIAQVEAAAQLREVARVQVTKRIDIRG